MQQGCCFKYLLCFRNFLNALYISKTLLKPGIISNIKIRMTVKLTSNKGTKTNYKMWH